jgi:pentatricopeptide repeat protein
MHGRGLDPNVFTYSAAISAAISACEKGQQPERALELLAEMQGQGLKPDVITYFASRDINLNVHSSCWQKYKDGAGPQHDHIQRSHQCMREGIST